MCIEAVTRHVWSYLSAFSCVFDAVKHGSQLGQPLSIHCGDTLHVLLRHKAHVLHQRHISVILLILTKFVGRQILYLGGHDELVVDDVVGSVAHTKQRARRMEVAGHACPHIHILPNTLGENT